MQPQSLGAKIQQNRDETTSQLEPIHVMYSSTGWFLKEIVRFSIWSLPKNCPGFKVFRSFLLIFKKNSRQFVAPRFRKIFSMSLILKAWPKKTVGQGFVNIEGVQVGDSMNVTDLDPLIWRSLTFFTIPKKVTFSRRIARIWCAFKCSKTCLQEHALLLSPFFCQPGSSCTKTSVFLEPKLNVAPFGGKTVFTFNVASVRSTNASKHFLKSFHVHHLELLVLRLLSMRLPWWDFM